MIEFQNKLHEYCFTNGLTNDEKEKLKIEIRRMLSVEAPFTAFKIWVIKKNKALNKIFKDLLPQFI